MHIIVAPTVHLLLIVNVFIILLDFRFNHALRLKIITLNLHLGQLVLLVLAISRLQLIRVTNAQLTKIQRIHLGRSVLGSLDCVCGARQFITLISQLFSLRCPLVGCRIHDSAVSERQNALKVTIRLAQLRPRSKLRRCPARARDVAPRGQVAGVLLLVHLALQNKCGFLVRCTVSAHIFAMRHHKRLAIERVSHVGCLCSFLIGKLRVRWVLGAQRLLHLVFESTSLIALPALSLSSLPQFSHSFLKLTPPNLPNLLHREPFTIATAPIRAN